MGKDLSIVRLFDIYKGLLTEKQREIFSSYYLYDLSLSEIAESFGISRQSAHDTIDTSCEKLLSLDKELNLKDKFDGVKKAVEEYGDNALAEKINEIIGG